MPAVAGIEGGSLVSEPEERVGSRAGAPPARPRAGVAQVSGVFSAFLVMMWVVVNARVLEITGRLRPKPIFIGSQWPWPHVASVATHRHPRNTRIGRLWHIAFFPLAARLAPAAEVGFVLTILVIRQYPGPNCAGQEPLRARPAGGLRQPRRLVVIAGIEETHAAESWFRAASR